MSTDPYDKTLTYDVLREKLAEAQEEIRMLTEQLDKPREYPGHPLFHQALDELRDLHVLKSGGYGTDSDPFANFTAIAAVSGKERCEYPVDRIVEKCTRVKSLIAQDRWGEIGEEFGDIAGLALCAEACRREDAEKHGGIEWYIAIDPATSEEPRPVVLRRQPQFDVDV